MPRKKSIEFLDQLIDSSRVSSAHRGSTVDQLNSSREFLRRSNQFLSPKKDSGKFNTIDRFD